MDNGKGKIITKKIKIYGIVQGVGFRPLVYRAARSLNIRGSVKNIGGYVEIIAQAEEELINKFLQQLKENQSGGYEIIRIEMEELVYEELSEFIIIRSDMSDEVSIIVPDLPVCNDCSKELYMDTDRRFHNPFISCMSCGPRYTIMEELPYDRHNTTMQDFVMCPECQEEYDSPESRRFHAQTISCNDCGPYLIYQDCMEAMFPKEQETGPLINQEAMLLENQKATPLINQEATPLINQEAMLLKDQEATPLINQEAYDKAVMVIMNGGIVAVKGIGGYHFVCSPFIEESVQNLRKLKGREEKPFAVMFPSMEEIKSYCNVSEEECNLLNSAARPIVLLHMHNNGMAPSVNKNSIYCGAFLPYTPLQLMLTKQCGPLVMTSANISDQPVIKEDEKLLSLKSPYLQGVLYNTRRIVRSVDDSVAKIIDGRPQLIRRSRGYVPYPVFIGGQREAYSENSKNEVIFAAGGDLKAAFCLYQEGKAVVSQYFGDLANINVMEEFHKSYHDLTGLLKLKPSLAVCDLHPNYLSSHFAKTLELPLLQVQHHHAHVASVMAEHELTGKVIGVAFDGTGYGTDGNIWGGEFLICEADQLIRAAHLGYVSILGGDSSVRDTKKTASCYLLHAGLSKYTEDERTEVIQAALDHRINTILTSSVGRLFDAVASILAIGQENRYEGECAALLEKEALFAVNNNIKPEKLAFAFSEKDGIIEIDVKPLLKDICLLRNKKERTSIALGFHIAMAEMIVKVCERLRTFYITDTVALCGGVFQNSVLTNETIKLLRKNKFQVYLNMSVPPNDGAISLGQTYIGLRSIEKERRT